MKAAIFLIFLFLLFCFLFGVSYVFWKLKKFFSGDPDPAVVAQPVGLPQPSAIPAPLFDNPDAPPDPIAQTLQKLAQASVLLREGALTPEEFEQLKKTILNAARDSRVTPARS